MAGKTTRYSRGNSAKLPGYRVFFGRERPRRWRDNDVRQYVDPIGGAEHVVLVRINGEWVDMTGTGFGV